MVHVAMFDAVNAIAPRYASYLALPTPAPGADARAAAVGAAYGVLVRLFPSQQATLDAARAASLAPIPDGPAKAAGLAFGDTAASTMVSLRANDNFLLANPVYVPLSGPEYYQLTPPAFSNPINQLAAIWAPFVMASSDQFRPNGPPALGSARFLAEYDEVRRLGVACPDPDELRAKRGADDDRPLARRRAGLAAVQPHREDPRRRVPPPRTFSTRRGPSRSSVSPSATPP